MATAEREEMATNGTSHDGLTPKQEKALAALLTEPTVTAAAAKVGVGERTVHTWLAEPTFADAYRAARRHAVGQAIARLQQGSTAAVDALLDVIDGAYATAPPAVRVSAAKVVLDMAFRAVELEDLQARLEALEQQLGATA